MIPKIAELRIPADPKYIVVAKRSSVAFAAIAGLDIAALDDISIAVAQACENAIAMTHEWSATCPTELRLEFAMCDKDCPGLEVRVRAICKGTKEKLLANDQQEHMRPQQISMRSMSPTSVVPVGVDPLFDMGVRLMQLFVDDCQYRLDPQRHGVQIQLTKYRIG